MQLFRQQPRVIVALHHPQGVVFQVFARHKPRRMLACTARGTAGFDATNAQPLALTQGVKTQAHVFAHTATPLVAHRPRCAGDVAV